jgi:hypothetical protein
VRDFLFDSGYWWAPVLICLAGIAVLISGNARQNKKILRSGVVVFLLGLLMATLNILIDTPREKVVKGTRALVQAAVVRDQGVFTAELHTNASLAGWNRQQIIDGMVVYADRFGLQSATITGMDTEVNPTMITVTMRVLATFNGHNTPYDNVPTDWQLKWWETSDGRWLLKDITPMGSGNLSGAQMSKQYFTGAP